TSQYTVNSLNELTTAPEPAGVQRFDTNGNLVIGHDLNWLYSYDAENRLVQQTRPGGAEGLGALTVFSYDGLGRLRIRQEYHQHCDPNINDESAAQFIEPDTGGGGGQNCYWILDSETRYIYDGWRVIQERDGSNNPQVSYTRGSDLSGSMEGAGG